jgi:hypothetical protein
MSLGSIIASAIKWISSLWATIPEAEREKIVGVAVEHLTTLFRAFYAAHKSQAEQNHGNARADAT